MIRPAQLMQKVMRGGPTRPWQTLTEASRTPGHPPEKTNLALALLCVPVIAITCLTDWQIGGAWKQINGALDALPPWYGCALAASIFGWFAAPPTLTLAAYACVGGDPTKAARKLFDAAIRRLGGPDSDDSDSDNSED